MPLIKRSVYQDRLGIIIGKVEKRVALSAADMSRVVELARERGIRVVSKNGLLRHLYI
jgi:hypothetical protein